MPATESVKKAVSAYQRRNPQKMREKTKAYREAHPDYTMNYYYSNHEAVCERNRVYQERRYRFKQEFRRLANICIL